MKKGLLCALVAAALCLPQIAWAQTDAAAEQRPAGAYDVFTLGDLVVSGQQGEAYQVAIKDVFDEDDIKATNVKTLGEALAYIPGMVFETGRKDQAGFSLNGFGASRVLVLVDGVPFYETSYRTMDLNQIPAAVISRVEVTKGNASVLYGPNAMGGVVNVITKKGAATPTVSGYAEIGENKTYNYGVAVSGSYGKVNGWFSVDHRETDGWEMSKDYKKKVGTITRTRGGGGASTINGILEDGGKRDNADNKTTSVWARVGVDLAPNSEYYASFHYVTKEGGSPTGTNTNAANYFTPDAFTQFNRWDLYEELGVDLTGKQEIFEGFTLLGKLFYHQHEDRYDSFYPRFWDSVNNEWVSTGIQDILYGGSGMDDSHIFDYDELDLYTELAARSVYKDTMMGGQAIADWKINDMHSVRGSVQYRQDRHKQSGDRHINVIPFDDATSYTGSVGLEYQLSLMDQHLIIIPGVSYDWFDLDKVKKWDSGTSSFSHPEKGGVKDSWNPMIGVNFMFPEYAGVLAGTELYGSVAKKTRFPTLREQATASAANPDLKPEKAINYNLGVKRGFFENKLVLELGGFFNDVSDWISSDQNWHTNDSGRATYINMQDVHIWGLQFNAMLNPIENLYLTLDYTWADAKNKSSKRVTDKVAGVYEQKLGVGATFIIPSITTRLDLRGIYVGDSYSQVPTYTSPDQATIKSDDYFIVNAKISKTLFDDKLEIYGTVNNIFDENYDHGGGYPSRGRSFMLGTRVTF